MCFLQILHKRGQLTGTVERQPTDAEVCTADCAKWGSATWLRKAHVSSAMVLLHHRAWSPTAVGVTVPAASELLSQLELWRLDAAFHDSLRPLAEAGAVGEGFLGCRSYALVAK